MNIDGCEALKDLKILPSWHTCCEGCYENWYNSEDWYGEHEMVVDEIVYYPCCTAVEDIWSEHGDESAMWDNDIDAYVWHSPNSPMLCPWNMP